MIRCDSRWNRDRRPIPRPRCTRRSIRQRNASRHHAAGVPAPRRAEEESQGDDRGNQPDAADHAVRLRRRVQKRDGLSRTAGRRSSCRSAARPRELAVQLRPRSNAYHEIWLDGEKVASTQEEEPFYGSTYLPRKFKCGVSLVDDNCVDIYSYDAGLIAMVEGGSVVGYNVVVGGGMGMTHGKEDTIARLAEPLGFVRPGDAVEAVRTIATVFRDHGNRADRRHARLKYVIHQWGIDRFRDEFRRRASFKLEDWRPIPRPVSHDHLGTHAQGDGRRFHGVFVANGRIKDDGPVRMKSALREIVGRHRAGIALTPHQNVLLTDLTDAAVADVGSILDDHGVAAVERLSAARRHSIACPALAHLWACDGGI